MTHRHDVAAPPPAVLEAARRWGLTLVEPTGSRYSHTWFATRAGDHVVVKVGDASARRREAATLGAYQRGAAALGRDPSPACVVLAEADVASADGAAALLLERVVPGFDLRPLARQDDDAATRVIGQLIADLHASAVAARSGATPGTGPQGVAAPHAAIGVEVAALPALATIAEAFDPPARHAAWPVGTAAPGLDPALVVRARAVLGELTAAAATDTVLHGDLHHANLVCDGGPAWRGLDQPERHDWRAIDPHGWFGDPHFDAVSMLLDLHATTPQARLSDAELRALTRRRADIIAEATGLDPHRIAAWAMVGAVISELWCLADHGFVQGAPRRLATVLLGA